MELYAYTIKLIDPLFFAQEGISGAFTPLYIHATALNHAFAWAIGQKREDQPYVMTEENGGSNYPRYTNSLIDKDFYLTPARLKGYSNYYTEIAKGDGDKYIQVRYGTSKMNGRYIRRRFHNEILKAYQLYPLSPESIFEGYLYTKLDISLFPTLIRLGSFRGLASLKLKGPFKVINYNEKQRYCDHPVDPLVSEVCRGITVSMLPYPVVDQALVDEVWEIRKYRQRIFVASLPNAAKATEQPIKSGSALIV